MFRPTSLFVGSGGGRVEGHAGLQAIQNRHQHCASIPQQAAKQNWPVIQGLHHLLQCQARQFFVTVTVIFLLDAETPHTHSTTTSEP